MPGAPSPSSFLEPLVASLLLVGPGGPSSVLAPSSDEKTRGSIPKW